MTAPPLPAQIEPIAYLAVEVKQREFEARLLIACHLLRLGYPVVVGQQWAIYSNFDTLPRGVALFKTVNGIQAANLANCHAFGHLVAATDEEVLICMEEHSFVLGFAPKAAANCDLFLAQSETHKTAIENKFPRMAGKVQIAGNCRVDLMTQTARASFNAEGQALRAQHGPYILFNTNFSSVNSVWGLKKVREIAVRAGTFDPNDEAGVRQYDAMLEWERKNLDEFLALLRWSLENLPEYNVVLRTHPAESPAFWEKEFAGTRAKVVLRSNPHPWILGADLSAHAGSTTGLEAMFLDRPIVNLAPMKRPDFEPIVNHVNPTFTRWQDAAEAMRSYLKDRSGPIVQGEDKYKEVLAQYFPGYREGTSTLTIARALAKLLRDHNAPPPSDYVLKVRAPGFKRVQRSDTLKDKMTASAQEVATSLTALAPLAGLTGNIGIQEIDDSLFLLLPASAQGQGQGARPKAAAV